MSSKINCTLKQILWVSNFVCRNHKIDGIHLDFWAVTSRTTMQLITKCVVLQKLNKLCVVLVTIIQL